MTYQTVISPIKKRESAAAATDFSSSISQVVAPLLEALQPILPHNSSMLHNESKSQKIYEILDLILSSWPNWLQSSMSLMESLQDFWGLLEFLYKMRLSVFPILAHLATVHFSGIEHKDSPPRWERSSSSQPSKTHH